MLDLAASTEPAERQLGRFVQPAAGAERRPFALAKRLGALAALDRCVRIRRVGLAGPNRREPGLEKKAVEGGADFCRAPLSRKPRLDLKAHGETPIFYAARLKRLKTLGLLIQAGAGPKHR
jgi:hypothetical protein